jgi:hypothetical protein
MKRAKAGQVLSGLPQLHAFGYQVFDIDFGFDLIYRRHGIGI